MTVQFSFVHLSRNALGAVVGAWFGAFPIPLDWDRPWQAWPITCVIGAVIGNALVGLSTLLTIRQLHNRSVRSDTAIAMNCVADLHLRFLVSLGQGFCLQRSAEIHAQCSRLSECCRQVERQVVGKSRNKIQQTWSIDFSQSRSVQQQVFEVCFRRLSQTCKSQNSDENVQISILISCPCPRNNLLCESKLLTRSSIATIV